MSCFCSRGACHRAEYVGCLFAVVVVIVGLYVIDMLLPCLLLLFSMTLLIIFAQHRIFGIVNSEIAQSVACLLDVS